MRDVTCFTQKEAHLYGGRLGIQDLQLYLQGQGMSADEASRKVRFLVSSSGVSLHHSTVRAIAGYCWSAGFTFVDILPLLRAHGFSPAQCWDEFLRVWWWWENSYRQDMESRFKLMEGSLKHE
ncbi:hypothetical protein [Pseudomonas aeruginosa]|uniref:Uncharacterized protein n=1 Tax=Pseudomonas phage KPP10 TaxID=582345 RepID=D6RRR4_BPKPP|nr:hypothetical protein [Pseudomonas aeruginosa]YP_004306712.1 hypothetical protein KPP10_gp115 [Pseudomonas phage KPP10]BAJ09082.1 hypothetical protein [Pseudomonas phage KPP10]